MTRPSTTARPSANTVAIGAVGGVANAAVVVALLVHFDNPLFGPPVDEVGLVATAFLFGFVPGFLSAHTRLLSPAGGFLALLAGATYAEVTTPAPRQVDELGGHAIVDGPFHLWNYATSWDVLLALSLVAGVAEFALRRGYGLRSGRLRNLPSLPLSRRQSAAVVVAAGGLVGLPTMRLLRESSTSTASGSLFVLGITAGVTAVALGAVLVRGLVSPLVLYALLVPHALLVEVFSSTDSPVHILLFAPYAFVLLIAWAIEDWLRSKRGWEGGRFTGPRSDP